MADTARRLARHLRRLYPRSAIATTLASPAVTAADFSRYRDDPVGFIRDVLGVTLTSDQRRIARRAAGAKPRRVKVNSGHSLGKTFLVACLVLWWFYTRDPAVVITTAPTERDVVDLLWTEVRLLQARARERLPSYFPGPRDPQMFHHDEHWAKGYTARKSQSFQGRHRPCMMFAFDESEGVDAPYWLSTNTMFQPDADHLWMAIGNPTTTSSQSYLEDLAVAPGGGPKWSIYQLSALDHPNVRAQLAGRPPPIPDAVTLGQVEQWVKDWTSPIAPGDRKPGDVEWPPPRPCPVCGIPEPEDEGAGLDVPTGVDGPVGGGGVVGLPNAGGGLGGTGPPVWTAGASGYSDSTKHNGGTDTAGRTGDAILGVSGREDRSGAGPGLPPAAAGPADDGGADSGHIRKPSGYSEEDENGVGEPCPTCAGARTVGGGRWVRPGPSFKSRVMGIRPTEGVDTVWSGAALDLAFTARWKPEDCWERLYPLVIGVDPAAYGDDDTAIHVRLGPLSLHHESHNGWDPGQTAARAKELCREWAGWYNALAFLDRPALRPTDVAVNVELDGGLGVGVLSHRGEFLAWRGVSVGSASKAFDPAGRPMYANLRSEVWFNAANAAAGGDMDLSRLPPDVRERLRIQLLAPYYEVRPGWGRFVEKKADTKERLGRSPDDADALILCYYNPPRHLPSVVTRGG